MKDSIFKTMNDIAKYKITEEELTKARETSVELLDYYQEHIHSTVMDRLFDNKVINETDDKGMALINYSITELLSHLNEVNTNSF